MPLMSPLGTQEFDKVATPLIASGRYNNADEVLHAALEALMREEADAETKAAWLEQALADGDASGTYEGDVFAEIRTRLGLPQRVRV